MTKRLITHALALGLGFSILASSAMAAELNLKAGYFISSKKSLFRQAFDQFVDKVNVDGKGLVQIPQVVGREAIPSRQMGNAVKSGLLDITGIPPAYMANLVKLATGFTSREVRRKGWTGLTDNSVIKEGIEVLIDYNCLIECVIDTAGRPSITYRIHPDIEVSRG